MILLVLRKAGLRDPERFLIESLQAETIFVFESLRAYRGIVFKPAEHLNRLFASAQTAGLKIPVSRDDLRKFLNRAAAGADGGDCFLRLTVSEDNVFILITRRVWPPEIYRKGICLQTTASKRSLSHAVPPETKTSCYGPEVLASLGMKPEYFETLFLSPEGFVRETRNSNLFMVKKGSCHTPPSVGILTGVTRNFVMEFAGEEGLDVRETLMTRHELFNADEVFLTNTSGEIIPVREIDSRKIGREIPGSRTRRLMKIFRRKVFETIGLPTGKRRDR